ncbi:MAG: hypothetical protein AB1489_42955, partial [Acidobacteriota bacterium]
KPKPIPKSTSDSLLQDSEYEDQKTIKTNGGTLLVFATGTARFSSNTGSGYFGIKVKIGDRETYTIKYYNAQTDQSGDQAKAKNPFRETLSICGQVINGIEAGNHVVTILGLNETIKTSNGSITCSTTIDEIDIFNLTVLELPF